MCIPCWNAFQQNLHQSQMANFAMLNYLQDQMAWMAGLPMRDQPRIRVPQPTYLTGSVNMNTTNNIKVESGSQVGQINAGAIVFLDQCVTALNDVQGFQQLAAELRDFTQQVVDSKELSADAQKQVLDLLKYFMEELTKGQDKTKNTSMLKLALQNIGPLVTAANAVASHWDKLKTMLEHFLK